MNQHHRLAIQLATIVVLTSFGGVGTVAAHGNDDPDHPACQGGKYKMSSEGSDVGGDTADSKWFVMPVCTDDHRDGPHHPHEHADTISMPESVTLECHDQGRERSDTFVDDARER